MKLAYSSFARLVTVEPQQNAMRNELIGDSFTTRTVHTIAYQYDLDINAQGQLI